MLSIRIALTVVLFPCCCFSSRYAAPSEGDVLHLLDVRRAAKVYESNTLVEQLGRRVACFLVEQKRGLPQESESVYISELEQKCEDDDAVRDQVTQTLESLASAPEFSEDAAAILKEGW
jgi:hypothetical protein